MMNKTSNVIMIFEDEIQKLVYEWMVIPDWVKAHVSLKCPAHRYEGELTLYTEKLVFVGWDIKVSRDFALEIPLSNITAVSMDFSKNLMQNTDPAFGLGGPTPFVVRYQDNGSERSVFFNTSFKNYLINGERTNRGWYEMLGEAVAAVQMSNAKQLHHREPAIV
ncbi:MAG: hypothetical protein JSV74_02255 [Dehalococcoidia bacterium]|nr:MAG: hypothetical protein JSV74_02255 [Dehalococcoidia bacterium]